MRSLRLRSNLRWANKNKQSNNKHKAEKKVGFSIQGIDIDSGKVQYTFSSIQEASDNLAFYFDIKKSTLHEYISKCLNGKIISYKKIQWQYSTLNTLPGEIWIDMYLEESNEPNKYMVSNKGRFKYPCGKITFGFKDEQGYMIIKINEIKYRVHRLVALYFIYNDDETNKIVVNHINENKSDNRVENLQCCTPSQNSQHSFRHKKVQCSCYNITFDSAEEAANWLIYNGIKKYAKAHTIRKTCSGISKSAYKLHWHYVEQ